MQKLILLAFVVVAVLALLAFLKARMTQPAAPTEIYYLRETLFTPAERSYLGVLEAVLPPGVRVFGKVRLEDFLGVKRGIEPAKRQAARNRISSKHVDFLLVRTSNLTPLAGIELDDSSHAEVSRQERDRFIDGAFASAGLPLLHTTAQKSYSTAEVKQKVLDLLAIKIGVSNYTTA